jgi:hypothetical protein
MEVWHGASVGLRSFLKGWSANLGSNKKREKALILSQIWTLDDRADSVGLSDDDWALRYHLEECIIQIYQREEEYWRHRGRLKWTLQGDANTKYFHVVANGWRRKCTISSLSSEAGFVSNKLEIQKLIYDFYRELMGTEDFYPITLVQGIWTEGQCASHEHNDSLIRSFLPEELDQVLKETKTDTALGPDGLPVIFFKSFWSLVKPLVLQLLNGFALGVLDISRLNFGILSLITKVPGAGDIKQFRPIALINVIFKLVSKAYAIRLAPIAHRVISTSQSAFIKGRLIHEGALALHEIVHELKVKKTRAVILKLDFEKAYDRVSWAFLRDVLIRKGFESGVVHRLMQLVTGGQTAISINGE